MNERKPTLDIKLSFTLVNELARADVAHSLKLDGLQLTKANWVHVRTVGQLFALMLTMNEFSISLDHAATIDRWRARQKKLLLDMQIVRRKPSPIPVDLRKIEL
jgi:hypothetical protein